VIGIAFVASSTIAALTGVLLGAYIGGAFLEMGQPYLLQSIGAVVLGGTLIFGGSATALGTLFGSVLLVLIVTTMQIAGLPPGTQDVIQGLVIIVVLALAGGLSLRRKGKAAQTSTDVGASPTTGRGGQPPEEGQPLERV
jgi:ribose transport system permease protein